MQSNRITGSDELQCEAECPNLQFRVTHTVKYNVIFVNFQDAITCSFQSCEKEWQKWADHLQSKYWLVGQQLSVYSITDLVR